MTSGVADGLLSIYFNYRVVDGPWGGANSFLRALGDQLRARPGVRVVASEQDEHDIFFMNQLGRGPGRPRWARQFLSPAEVRRLRLYGARSPLAALARGWPGSRRTRRGKYLVCRVVNLLEHAYGKPSRRDRDLLKALQYTHFDIFQSRYLYEMFLRAGYAKEHWAIIYNGVDQRTFHMRDKVWWDGTEPLRIFSATYTRRTTKRFDIIAAISELPGVESYHVGIWPENVAPRRVRLLGVLPQERLVELYRRQAHIFLHPAEKDICPNAVVEALSCGLPVIYNRPGGTEELVGPCGVAVGEDLGATVDAIRQSYEAYVAQIHERWTEYSIEFAATRYLEVFQQVLQRKPEASYVATTPHSY